MSELQSAIWLARRIRHEVRPGDAGTAVHRQVCRAYAPPANAGYALRKHSTEFLTWV